MARVTPSPPTLILIENPAYVLHCLFLLQCKFPENLPSRAHDVKNNDNDNDDDDNDKK